MTADLASCSALGGALLTAGAQVGDLAVAVLQADPSGPAGVEGAALDRTAGLLEGLGAALQRFCTDRAEIAVLARSLDADLAAWDLELVAGRVREAPGPSRRDPAERLAARDRLQAVADRLGRRSDAALGELARRADDASRALREVAQGARARA